MTNLLDTIAEEAIRLLGTPRQVAPYSERFPAFDLAAAYDVGERIRAKRESRGARVAGRKIGFTNCGIWSTYGVTGPIWSYMYDESVRELTTGATFDAASLPEPLIEPEIALHFAAPPCADMSDAELLRCVDWVAHGFEIVVSIFPGWKFAAADTIAGYGMHHTLLLGPGADVGADRRRWMHDLDAFTITMSNGEGHERRGCGRDVLGGPLQAVRFMLAEIARYHCPPVRAGEIVTTGTLTEAMPMVAGQTWTTRLDGIALRGLALRIGDA